MVIMAKKRADVVKFQHHLADEEMLKILNRQISCLYTVPQEVFLKLESH